MKNNMNTFYKKQFGFDVIDKIGTDKGLILTLKNNITSNQAQTYFTFNQKGYKIETPKGYYLNEK